MFLAGYKAAIKAIEEGREGSGFWVTLYCAGGHTFTGAVWAPQVWVHHATVRIDPDNDESQRVYVDLAAVIAVQLAEQP